MSAKLHGKEELKARLRAVRLSFKPIGRDWADKTAEAARPMVPYKTGQLRRSIRRRNATMKRATVVAHYTQYFVDAGAVPHTILAKKRKTLAFTNRRGEHVFARKVHHRGVRARPFRRRAAEAGMRRTPMVDIIIAQWNSAGGKGSRVRSGRQR